MVTLVFGLFVMYYIYGSVGPSLLIESTNSMIESTDSMITISSKSDHYPLHCIYLYHISSLLLHDCPNLRKFNVAIKRFVCNESSLLADTAGHIHMNFQLLVFVCGIF